MIERGRAADLRFGELQVGGDARDGLVGDPAGDGLDLAEDVEQDRRVLGMAGDDIFLL